MPRRRSNTNAVHRANPAALALACASLLLPACASSSMRFFDPSRPVERSTSLSDALLLCDEFKLAATDEIEAGNASLTPLLECLNRAISVHASIPPPPGGGRPPRLAEARVFQAEAHAAYRVLSATAAESGAREYEAAFHAAIRGLRGADRAPAPLMVRYFPRTAEVLKARSTNARDY